MILHLNYHLLFCTIAAYPSQPSALLSASGCSQPWAPTFFFVSFSLSHSRFLVLSTWCHLFRGLVADALLFATSPLPLALPLRIYSARGWLPSTCFVCALRRGVCTQYPALSSIAPCLYSVCSPELGITWEHPGAQGTVHQSATIAGLSTRGATLPLFFRSSLCVQHIPSLSPPIVLVVLWGYSPPGGPYICICFPCIFSAMGWRSDLPQ